MEEDLVIAQPRIHRDIRCCTGPGNPDFGHLPLFPIPHPADGAAGDIAERRPGADRDVALADGNIGHLTGQRHPVDVTGRGMPEKQHGRVGPDGSKGNQPILPRITGDNLLWE
jgi:hypothetical protein